MKVVITDYMGDNPDHERSRLKRAGFEVFVAASKATEDWIAEAHDADAVICRHALLTDDVIQKLQACRLIARYGAGVDNIDLTAARRAGISVTNAPGFCADEVAEHALALFLAVERRTAWFDRHVRRGDWTPDSTPPMRRLSGITAGVVGLGAIGRAVVARLGPLVSRIVVFDPYVDGSQAAEMTDVTFADDLSELVTHSDALFLHVPLVPDTHGMVSRSLIDALPAGATIINCARGPVCDETALLDALRQGHLRGIGIDTRVEEPPAYGDQLRLHPFVVSTPHVGYLSQESLATAKQGCVEEVMRLTRGEAPSHPVVVGA